jgi:hypothetical protein
MSGPEFDELVGAEPHGAERERLRRAHDALVAAGPAPELPASLADPPDPTPVRRLLLPARRRRTPVLRLLPLAAALAIAAFAGGYLLGNSDEPTAFDTDFVVTMRPTSAAPNASASLRVGPRDDAGNWPMEVKVAGLQTGRRYELWLTRGSRRAALCGSFAVRPDRTTVYLNAPYRFKSFDGWVMTPEDSQRVLLRSDMA